MKEPSFRKENRRDDGGAVSRERDLAEDRESNPEGSQRERISRNSPRCRERHCRKLVREKIECAFLALHGRFGEDGRFRGCWS